MPPPICDVQIPATPWCCPFLSLEEEILQKVGSREGVFRMLVFCPRPDSQSSIPGSYEEGWCWSSVRSQETLAVNRTEYELGSWVGVEDFCKFQDFEKKEGLLNGRSNRRGDVTFLIPPICFRHYESVRAGDFVRIYANGIKVTIEGTVDWDSNYDPAESHYSVRQEQYSLLALLVVVERMAATPDMHFIRDRLTMLVKQEIARLEEPAVRQARDLIISYHVKLAEKNRRQAEQEQARDETERAAALAALAAMDATLETSDDEDYSDADPEEV